MRIAFFGGSFDPPHVGHLRIARAAAERLHLDRILLAPVALQPLKRERPLPASYADRLAMLRLLIEGDPHPCMEVSELDAPRPDGKPNYTYDTLFAMREQLLPEDKLFVLLGADSFLSMRQWYRAAELLLLADWIVAARPGSNLQQLDRALPPGIDPSPNSEQRDGCIIQQLTASSGRSATLYLLPDLREDVSATAIRAALAELAPSQPFAQRDTSRQVLTPSVIAYIRERGLYR